MFRLKVASHRSHSGCESRPGIFAGNQILHALIFFTSSAGENYAIRSLIARPIVQCLLQPHTQTFGLNRDRVLINSDYLRRRKRGKRRFVSDKVKLFLSRLDVSTWLNVRRCQSGTEGDSFPWLIVNSELSRLHMHELCMVEKLIVGLINFLWHRNGAESVRNIMSQEVLQPVVATT